MEYYLITFQSTHDAIVSKQYLGEKLPIVIMPTLREISNSCGISIRVQEGHDKMARELMEKGPVREYKIYKIAKDAITCIKE